MAITGAAWEVGGDDNKPPSKPAAEATTTLDAVASFHYRND